MQYFSHENDFHLHENGRVGETNFHKKSFALRLVLTQRQSRTRKWAILNEHSVSVWQSVDIVKSYLDSLDDQCW